MLSFSFLLLSVLAVHASPANNRYRRNNWPLLDIDKLMDQVNQKDLNAGALKLQSFADGANGTRVFGRPGHIATVDWLYDTLSSLDAYNVTKQTLTAYGYTLLNNATVTLSSGNVETSTPDFSPAGKAEGTLVAAGLGCEPSDFPAEVGGNIGFVQRGTCEFGLKVALAQAAGASGLIIGNNDEENPDDFAPAVTLGEPTRPQGGFVPTVVVSLNSADSLTQAIVAGGVTASITVDSQTDTYPTDNVIATSYMGDQDNVITVGAHTDSVAAGPGINDDGSGTVSLLYLAKYLADYKFTNAVRFGFWTAEEVGLVGSTYYVESLSQSEISKIRLNLNYDMVASPNYYFGIYDGDGSAFNLTGPAGSDQIEALIQGYYSDRDIYYTQIPFDGRSDYAAFIENGVPAGGIFTGAEDLKSVEEARYIGGTAGLAYDENYHEVGDDIDNLDYEAWVQNTKLIAYSIGTYALSLEGFPANNATAFTPAKRSLAEPKPKKSGCHGEKVLAVW